MRSGAGASSPNPSTKKDPNAVPLTPLEKMLLDAGPLRDDGSDKFWGLENPNGQAPLSPAKPKTTTVGSSARNPGGPAPSPKPEDKDSPEAKKRAATALGPNVSMTFDNTAAYGMPESLFTSMKDIFEAILAHHSRIGVLSPHKFLEVLRRENEMFRTSMHQDAHEFLNLLLNEVIANVEANAKKNEAEKALNGSAEPADFEKALASAMPRMKNGGLEHDTDWVHDLFEGTLTSETRCLTCENISQRDEAFLDLSVDLDQHSSVTSCLRKFSEEEMLCERNKFHCDGCGGLQEAEKRMKIKRLPKILALHLKRFKYTEDLQRLQKLFHRVVYPYHLRLFNTTDDAEDPDRLYELYAVVVHIGGGPYHGHYVSVIKTQDRGWLLFDDESVEPVDKDYVRNFFGDTNKLACAYVLFYQETTIEAVKREQAAESRAQAVKEAELAKEAAGLGIKTNGVFMNGIQHVKSAVSPTPISPVGDDSFRWDGLEKAVTEPPSVAVQPPPESLVAPLNASPLSPTKGDTMSKKERAKEEKERKSAEKEKEKAEKARLKTLEVKRKEYDKKQAADVKAAIEASKASKHEEDQRVASVDGAREAGAKESAISGSLSRFRAGSKSLSKRPKLWGFSRENNKDEPVIDGDENATSAPAAEKPEKSKNPFSSLRKKTSSMML
ncbi:MAG: hypothetical protein Q9191_001383 [Dirinaria sp. TL-2023a]